MRINLIQNRLENKFFKKNEQKNNHSNIVFTSKYSDAENLANQLAIKAKIFFNAGIKGIERKNFGNGIELETRFNNGKILFQNAKDKYNKTLYRLNYDSNGELLKITQFKSDGTKISESFKKHTDFDAEKITENDNKGYIKEYYYKMKKIFKFVERDNMGFSYEEYINNNEKPIKIISKIKNQECCADYFYPNGNLYKTAKRDIKGVTTTHIYSVKGDLIQSMLDEPNIGDIKQIYFSSGKLLKFVNTLKNGEILTNFFDTNEKIIRTEHILPWKSKTTCYLDKNGKLFKSVEEFKNGIKKTIEYKFDKSTTSKVENSNGESLLGIYDPNKELQSLEYKYNNGYSIIAKYNNGNLSSFLDSNGRIPLIDGNEFFELCKKIIPKEEKNSIPHFIDDIKTYFYISSN